jgi:hypothetical protein
VVQISVGGRGKFQGPEKQRRDCDPCTNIPSYWLLVIVVSCFRRVGLPKHPRAAYKQFLCSSPLKKLASGANPAIKGNNASAEKL